MSPEIPKFSQVSSKAAIGVELSSLAEEGVQVERRWADILGIGLSGLCLVHCLLTPIVLLLLPSLQLFDYHETFHRALFVVLPIIALGAFIPGYLRHRDARVFFWSFPGLVLLMLGAFVVHEELLLNAMVNISGSAFLIRAHLLNRKLCEETASVGACAVGCSHQHHLHKRISRR